MEIIIENKIKIMKITKWISIMLSIIIFIIEFLLSYNGIDLFTPMGYIGSIVMILGIITFILSLKKINNLKFELNKIYKQKFYIREDTTKEKEDEIIENFLNKNQINNKYEAKCLVTKNEMYFYNVIEENFGQNYKVQTQINLATIINKIKENPREYQNELYRNIDIGIFEKETLKPLLLIEINDNTHNQAKRKYRDMKVKQICETAGIKLINFYTKFSNKESYIVERIQNELVNAAIEI